MWSFSSLRGSGKNILFCLFGKTKKFSKLYLFTCILIFYSDIFDKIDNFAFIVLTIPVPVFELGISFGKVQSGNLYSKLRRNPVALKNFSQCHFTVEFWRQFPECKYPEIKGPMHDPFLYLAYILLWFLFSVMKCVKWNHRVTLTNQDLGELIRSSLTINCQDFRRHAYQTKT